MVYPTVTIGGPVDNGPPADNLTAAEAWSYIGALFSVGTLHYLMSGKADILVAAAGVTALLAVANRGAAANDGTPPRPARRNPRSR